MAMLRKIVHYCLMLQILHQVSISTTLIFQNLVVYTDQFKKKRYRECQKFWTTLILCLCNVKFRHIYLSEIFIHMVKCFNVLLHLSVFLLTTTTLTTCRYIYGAVFKFVNYIELKLDSSDGFLRIYSSLN